MVVVGSYAVGVFRESFLAQPVVTLTPQAHLSVQSIIFGGCVLICLAAALGLFTSRRISQPLQDMRRGAERFAAGDFSSRLTIPDTVELASLALTLNRMAAQLAEQIAVITQQRNEQEAILESMREGVLALDTQERVITVNRAAEALLGVVATQAKGRIIQEVVRNVTLQRLVAAAMHSTESATADIVLRGAEERFLQATATALRDAQGQDIGVLVVLNDVTQLRHLENIRRDFVSNVSHELKTPITSIKGFVETLRDGALDNREHAERFLGIIARHAERLHAIIEDLLALSRLEQGDESYDIPRSETFLADVMQAAILDCAAKAEAQRVTVVPRAQRSYARRSTLHCSSRPSSTCSRMPLPTAILTVASGCAHARTTTCWSSTCVIKVSAFRTTTSIVSLSVFTVLIRRAVASAAVQVSGSLS